MYENYALEAEDPDTHLPTGSFYMNEAATRAAAREVLGTHKGLKGHALDDYMATYFAKAWGHFDVNRTGKVNPTFMPSLMRFLMSDQYIQL